MHKLETQCLNWLYYRPLAVLPLLGIISLSYPVPGTLTRLEHMGKTDLSSWPLRPTVHNFGPQAGKNCSCHAASNHVTWNGARLDKSPASVVVYMCPMSCIKLVAYIRYAVPRSLAVTLDTVRLEVILIVLNLLLDLKAIVSHNPH